MDLGARLSRVVLLSILSLGTILGCSSGGGGSSPDTTPNPVTVTVQPPATGSDIRPGSTQVSNAVTVTGINQSVPVSITSMPAGAVLIINIHRQLG